MSAWWSWLLTAAGGRGSTLRRRLKRRQWAREQRNLEASLFNLGSPAAWRAVKARNDLSRVWRRPS